MIHRQNYLDIRAYLRYMERKQLDPATVKRARGHLRHLLEWADETPLTKARSIDPVFPAYLVTARITNSPFQKKLPPQHGLAPSSIIKCLANTRAYFEFARNEWTLRYKSITSSWIDLLQPARYLRAESRLLVRQYWTLDQALKIASVDTETLREARGQVAVCMLFLSGMRAEALASMPIHCVDIPNHTIRQLPEAGVKTKNRKAAITFLLPIPKLLEVVSRWDQHVRASMSPMSLWYANLSSDGMTLQETVYARDQRNSTIEDDVKIICSRAGLPYLSPHKLRHGHAVYGLKCARTPEELKAVSQNIMHVSLVTTDSIYGNLISNDVQSIIASLGKQNVPAPLAQELSKEQITAQISALIELLKT